jgi:nucleotide-binding universal stress UspA family protein
MFERILVPLDGSQFSARALPYASEVAKRFHAEVILLQMVQMEPIVPALAPTGAMGVPNTSPAAMQMMVDAARKQDKKNAAKAKRYLRGKIRDLQKQELKSSYSVMIGDAAQGIIDFCQQESVGLVVMTTTGKSGLKRAFLGSVADRVIREPGLPVLVIRPEKRPRKR